MEQQEAWRPHADFMNALVDDGFVLLGGPLEEPDVLLIIRANSAMRSARASRPIHGIGWGCSRSRAISPWTLRLGKLP